MEGDVMYKRRACYLLLIIVTIVLGLVSRKIGGIPLVGGDLLYAVMMYWVFRFLLVTDSRRLALLWAILTCLIIEILQAINTPALAALRSHQYLRLVFGQGFLWMDLPAYVLGALVACAIDSWWIGGKLGCK